MNSANEVVRELGVDAESIEKKEAVGCEIIHEKKETVGCEAVHEKKEVLDCEAVCEKKAQTEAETQEKTESKTEQKSASALIDAKLAKALHKVKNAKENPMEESEQPADRRYEQEKENPDELKNVNSRVLLKYIAPQIEENEKKKREHKTYLIKSLLRFLNFQGFALFVFIASIMFGVLYGHINRHDFSPEYLDIIFKFFLSYITSLVAEVLIILKIIVKNVFDSSISDLMKFYKDSTSGVNGTVKEEEKDEPEDVATSIKAKLLNE